MSLSPGSRLGDYEVTALIGGLVEGDDLSQRIARGAIPLDEALPMANPHPDGKRVAAAAAQVQADAVEDKVAFVFNFADYLRTIAPGNK